MIERELLGTPILLGGVLSDAGAQIVRRAPARSYALITDDNVGALPHLEHVEASLRSASQGSRVLCRQIPAGEAQKTREQWMSLSDWLLSESCGRDTTVVALGGGVVGDLAGFVAATFLRGVPVVQIPTTLVAMVDAAVGGKTGVDTPAGKNLIGAFHRPSLVLIDPGVLQTLPVEHVRAGFAEVLKHGAIADSAYFHSAAAHSTALASAPITAARSWWRSDAARDLILRSVEIKSAFVAADEKESGAREALNFGHTVAHAIETLSNFAVLHGHAVAMGMVAEAMLGELIGHSSAGTADALRKALSAAGLPTHLTTPFGDEPLIAAMQVDKKVRAGEIRFALPAEIGNFGARDGRWSVAAPRSAIVQALHAIGPAEIAGHVTR